MSVTVVTVYLLFLCAQSGNANSGQRDTFPDTLHAHKALSHLLPINDTEEIGCILLPTVYNVQKFPGFSGNGHACASSGYQGAFSPSTQPGYEA